MAKAIMGLRKWGLAMGVVMGMVALGSAETGDVLISFPTPGRCSTGLAFDGEFLWAADRKTDSLYQINPKNGSVIRVIPTPGYHPAGLAFDREYLWCADRARRVVYQLDPRSGMMLKAIDSPSPSPGGLAWDGANLWLADGQEDRIFQISTDDGTTIRSIPSPSDDSQGLAYDGRYLWVSDRIQDRIYMVTPELGEVILSLPSPGPYARGLAWDEGALWNVDYQTDWVYRIKIGDDISFSRTDPKEELLEYTHEFRNFGPGTVKGLDIYLALPQDLDNQEILGEISFNPPPTDFLTDEWGQRVAHYHFDELESGKFASAGYTVKARMYEIYYFIFPEKVGRLKNIPKEIRKKYLVDAPKFALGDPVIQNAVREAVGEEKNPYWIARKIYRYVLEHMFYELAGGWNIAPTVLARGSGSCSEYSFVYISLCRAAGLPARYVGSVAVRGDDASTDEVFHRWVEIYLPPYGWIPVDPSRGDKETPAGQADGFGYASNRCLITTISGGDSEYLGWTYNSNDRWTAIGKCKVETENIGEWSPLTPAGKEESVQPGDYCEPK